MDFKQIYTTIDTQIQGEVFRIVTNSPISLTEDELIKNQHRLNRNYDEVKRLLLKEPRGHRGINGVIRTDLKEDEVSFCTFNHQDSNYYKPEAAIALLAAEIQLGFVAYELNKVYTVKHANKEIKIQAQYKNDLLKFSYAPSVAKRTDSKNEYEYEGELYEIHENIGIKLCSQELPNLKKWYEQHRKENEILILIEKESERVFKTLTFETDGFIRRSPGIAQTMILAEHYKEFTQITNKSIFNSEFIVQKISEEQYKIQSEAYVISLSDFIYDLEDPLENGFILV